MNILNPLFEGQKRHFFNEFFSDEWLVIKSGFYSRAGYDGSHTVYENSYIFQPQKIIVSTKTIQRNKVYETEFFG